MSGLILVLVALVCAGPAWPLDATSYRYERLLRGAATDKPTFFGPDRAMYGHAQTGFADLRIVDGAGNEVPWRILPQRRKPSLRPLSQQGWRLRTRDSETRVDLDLEYPNVPVDALAVSSRTPDYERSVTVEGSNDGERWKTLASVRISSDSTDYSFGREPATEIRVKGRHRYLRLTIENGDDRPLDHIGVAPHAFSRPLLAEGGHPGPVRAFYGNPSARPSSYDFARLPAPGPRARAYGFLGPERMNALFEPPPATRSITARHPALVIATLVFVVLAGAAAGLLALRRRT